MTVLKVSAGVGVAFLIGVGANFGAGAVAGGGGTFGAGAAFGAVGADGVGVVGRAEGTRFDGRGATDGEGLRRRGVCSGKDINATLLGD